MNRKIYILIPLLLILFISGCSEETYIVTRDKNSCPKNAWCDEFPYTNSTIYLDYLYNNQTIRMEMN